ncbi:hypothetical protein [Mesorhizobium sp. 131-2-1]|uniref:hypothetical protein n=1 Tax=Mesorhizobium sp. 131-2-1 TaxID=2744518 RepID=UPI0019370D31|nr:hypothetical protein [Mesorhizobium sp. 131-2-1]BCG94364.1 hypothetical protein MesoLj131a_32280 [Mesorhizobium sp. 131-2-1]
MSGILSAVSSDACILLTDGAVYDRAGVLLEIKRKVAVSERLPLAVATRGNVALANFVTSGVIHSAERVGFDRMMMDLEEALGSAPEEPHIDVLIAGISETAGPTHRRFHTRQTFDGCEPRTLIDPGLMYFGFGSDGRAVTLRDFGIPAPHKDETLQTWLSRYGVNIFEFFRRIPVPIDPDDPNTDRQHLIGGRLDLTVVRRGSVSTTMLHRWPDEVGERINPFRHEVREAA